MYGGLRNFDDLRSGTVMHRSHEIGDAAYWLRVRKFHAPLGDDSYARRRAKNKISAAAYVVVSIRDTIAILRLPILSNLNKIARSRRTRYSRFRHGGIVLSLSAIPFRIIA